MRVKIDAEDMREALKTMGTWSTAIELAALTKSSAPAVHAALVPLRRAGRVIRQKRLGRQYSYKLKPTTRASP